MKPFFLLHIVPLSFHSSGATRLKVATYMHNDGALGKDIIPSRIVGRTVLLLFIQM